MYMGRCLWNVTQGAHTQTLRAHHTAQQLHLSTSRMSGKAAKFYLGPLLLGPKDVQGACRLQAQDVV